MLHGIDPVFAVSGLVVGLLVGFTGVGGGSLMTPLLVLVFRVHPATAVGTDLLYAGLTKISGCAVHAYHGSVDWRITRRLAYGSVPAALLSLVLLAHLGSSSKASGGIISTTLGIALILTAVTLDIPQSPARPPLAAYGRRERANDGRSHRRAWRGSRRAGVDFLRRRRCDRRHDIAHALSEVANRPHRRLGHRARGAADPHRRRRALVAGLR